MFKNAKFCLKMQKSEIIEGIIEKSPIFGGFCRSPRTMHEKECQEQKNVFTLFLFLTNKARSFYRYVMKTTNRKLTVETGTDAKVRLMEMQAELIKAGCSARRVSPGKIVAELLLMQGAIEYLRTKLSPINEIYCF